jgi:hypothetical protein
MELECIAIGISCILYMHVLDFIVCVLDWRLDHICAFGNWFEMLLLGNFHDGFDS